MSIEIMSEVWKHAPVDQGALLVLLALADSADDGSRSCYPGIEKTLAPKTRLSPRQVKRCIRDLADQGIIEVARNTSPLKTNLYKIRPLAAWRSDIMSPRERKPEVTSATSRSDAHVTSEVTPMSPKPSVTSEETSVTRESALPLFSEEDQDKTQDSVQAFDHFNEFWDLYPKNQRKAGKAKCRARFWSVVHGKAKDVEERVTGEQLVQALRAYVATNPDPKFVPAPLVWLNGCKWEAFVGVEQYREEDLHINQRNALQYGAIPPSMKLPDGTPNACARYWLKAYGHLREAAE